MKDKEKILKSVKKIPGPMCLPFFGTTLSSHELRSKDLVSGCEEQLKLFGPIIKHEYYWNQPIIVLLDSEDISKILRADKLSFRPPNGITLMARMSLPDRYLHTGLTDPNQGVGLHFRKLLHSVSLSNRNVTEFLPQVNEIVADLIQELRNQVPLVTNPGSSFEKITWDLACFYMLGIRTRLTSGEYNQDWEDFINLQTSYWSDIAKSYQGFPLWQYFSTPLWKRYRITESRIWEIAHKMYNQMPEGDALLQQIFALDQIPEEEKPILIADLLMASSHPVSNTIFLTLYGIAKDERVQEKLRKELKSKLPRKNTPITQELLDSMEYLRAVLKESFRLNPTTPNLARILTTDIQIREYNIPAGTPILCQTWFNCLKEENFARPKEFLPERWIPNQARHYKPHKHNLVAHFGHGKQMCPGRVIATQALQIIIAQVFRNFKVTCASDLVTEYILLRDPANKVSFHMEELED